MLISFAVAISSIHQGLPSICDCATGVVKIWRNRSPYFKRILFYRIVGFSHDFHKFPILWHRRTHVQPISGAPFWASGLLVLSEPGAHFRKYSLAIPDLVRQRATSSYLQKNKKTAENQTLWQTNFLSHWFTLIYLPKPRFLNVENIVLMVKTIPMDPHNVGEGAANPLIIIPQPHFLRRYGWIHRDIHIYIHLHITIIIHIYTVYYI